MSITLAFGRVDLFGEVEHRRRRRAYAAAAALVPAALAGSPPSGDSTITSKPSLREEAADAALADAVGRDDVRVDADLFADASRGAPRRVLALPSNRCWLAKVHHPDGFELELLAELRVREDREPRRGRVQQPAQRRSQLRRAHEHRLDALASPPSRLRARPRARAARRSAGRSRRTNRGRRCAASRRARARRAGRA